MLIAESAVGDVSVTGDVTFYFTSLYDQNGDLTGYRYDGYAVNIPLTCNIPIVEPIGLKTYQLSKPGLLWSDASNWDNPLLALADAGVVLTPLINDGRGQVSLKEHWEMVDTLLNSGPTERDVSVPGLKVEVGVEGVPRVELGVGFTMKWNVHLDPGADIVMDQRVVVESLSVHQGAHVTGNDTFVTRTDLANWGLFDNLMGTVERDFINRGELIEGGGAMVTGPLNVQGNVDNSGEIRILGGSLNLSQIGMTNTGTVYVATNGNLRLQDGTVVHGSGPIVINGGEVLGAGLHSVFGMDTDVRLQSGSVGGGQGVAAAGTFDWTGGVIAGTLFNAGNDFVISGPDDKVILRASTLVNMGTIRQIGTSAVAMLGYYDYGPQSPVLDNEPGAVYDLTGDGSVLGNSNGLGRIDNAGTFRKSGGTGESVIQPAFNNTGTVEVDSGVLALQGGGEFKNATASVADGASLRVASGVNVTADSTFQGPGTVAVASGGGLNLGDGVTVHGSGPIVVNGGALSGAGQNSIFGADTDVRLQSGSVGGGQGVEVAGSFNWTGGVIAGTLLNAGNDFVISGPDDKVILRASTLVNMGTIRQIGTSAVAMLGYYDYGPQSPVLDNEPGAVYDLTGDGSLLGNSNRLGRIDNAATFRKSGGTGESVIQPAFSNSGRVEAASGTLAFRGGFTQTAGSTKLMGGNISSTSLFTIQGGVLAGNGRILGDVHNTGGIVSPGFSPGTITIEGDYTQGHDATLSLEIAGLQPGQFDVFNVTGTATLDGILDISFLNGFRPALGDSFEMFTYGSHVGEFDSIFFTGLSGFEFTPIYGLDGLTIRTDSVQAVPLPESVWLGAAAVLVSLCFMYRREHGSEFRNEPG